MKKANKNPNEYLTEFGNMTNRKVFDWTNFTKILLVCLKYVFRMSLRFDLHKNGSCCAEVKYMYMELVYRGATLVTEAKQIPSIHWLEERKCFVPTASSLKTN